jgi:hypothetical protein
MQKISEIEVEKAKTIDPQTVREEQKDMVVLSQPPVQTSSTIDRPALQEQQQAVKEIVPETSVHQPEPYKLKEQPKEKKSRFGFFGKKRTNEDRSKEAIDKKDNYKYKPEEKSAAEEQEEEEKGNERAKLKEEEAQRSDKQRNLREDKETKEQEEQDKVVYLTDEDIEDLLK